MYSAKRSVSPEMGSSRAITSRDGKLDVFIERRFSKDNSTLQRLHFLVEEAHTQRSSSPFRVSNESRIAHPPGVHVLPCFGCPSPLYSPFPSHQIRALRHSRRETVCPLLCANSRGPVKLHCISSNSEGLPGRYGINTELRSEAQHAEEKTISTPCQELNS